MLRFILSVSALVALAMAEDGAIEPHFTLELLGDMVKRHLTGNVQLKNAPSRQSDFLIRHSHDKPQAEHLGAPTFQALNGLYVTPCEDLSDQVIGGPYPLSAFSIREFEGPRQGNTWHLLLTWYWSDNTCKPLNSNIVGQFDIYGNISYAGKNVVIHGAERVIYQVDRGTYFFPTNKYQQAILDDLSDACPCHLANGWQGGNQTVNATSCNREAIVENRTAPDFCRFIAGEQLFGNIQYTTPQQNDYYISASEFDNQLGWTNPVNKTYFIEILKESGNNDPSQCLYNNYLLCNENVTNAATICDTCASRLECSGCLFRELPDDDAGEYGWVNCCPCIHQYAKKEGVPWMDDLFC